jgi:hypothetical protein
MSTLKDLKWFWFSNLYAKKINAQGLSLVKFGIMRMDETYTHLNYLFLHFTVRWIK